MAINPIHLAGEVITKLNAIEWDSGNDFFPPTSFQISNINSGTGATNVIPEVAEMVFNFRFSTETTAEIIQERVEATIQSVLAESGATYQSQWRLSGNPFLTSEGQLVSACQQAIHDVLQIQTELSTGGGTSDGRFIATTGAQVVEFGPVNASIHQINEHIEIASLEKLSQSYHAILRNLLT